LLPAYGVRPEQTYIQMGWARGLNYYTGIVFELYDATGEQIGGGGRYDDLLRVLGATQDTPAVGFAYRLDRILAEMRRQDLISVAPPAPAALIVPVDAADDSEAARVAMALREHAIVELYVPPTRSLSQVLARADKRGMPYVVIIGEAERRTGTLTVRDMRAGQQFSATLDELRARIGEVNHA
jgi:histidyl-tRNA synthetase